MNDSEQTAPNKDTLSIVSPFPLLSARSRLESRTEPAVVWALRGQTRIVVETWGIDARTVGFTIRRAPKSSLEFDFPVVNRRLRGTLVERADGSTQVTAALEKNYLAFVLEWFFTLLLGGIAAMWIGSLTFGATRSVFWVIIAGGFAALAAVGGIQWFTERHYAYLLTVAREALLGASQWDEDILREIEGAKHKRE
jgi:hypothetical protein